MTIAGRPPATAVLFGDRYRTIPEDRIVDTLILAGWAYEPDDPIAHVRARRTLEDWIAAGLPYRLTPSATRLLDPVEVWHVMKQLGQSGRDPYFKARHVATGRRLVTDFARSAMSGGPIVVDLCRTFYTTGLPPGKALRLRLPLPLDQVHAGRSVEILGETADLGVVTCHANRLELRCYPSEQPLTLAVRASFSAPHATTTAAEPERYLAAREGMVVVSPRIHDLARALARPGCTIAQAVRAFWVFLIERFTCVPLHYDQIDAEAPCDWVLDSRSYDCRLGAALFVALCRARGIPARLVGGHVLYARAPTNHVWAEYRCPHDGWTPVDFLGWDLSGGGDDPVWRDRFFGQLDARLVTEILPLAFVGRPGVPVPAQWHLLQTIADRGIEIAMTALDGRPIYTDGVRVAA